MNFHWIQNKAFLSQFSDDDQFQEYTSGDETIRVDSEKRALYYFYRKKLGLTNHDELMRPKVDYHQQFAGNREFEKAYEEFLYNSPPVTIVMNNKTYTITRNKYFCPSLVDMTRGVIGKVHVSINT